MPLSAPTAVAYFVVRVPLDRTSVATEEDAERTVARYLYAGAEVVMSDLDASSSPVVWEVLVRMESFAEPSPGLRAGSQFDTRITYQQDRLRSGLYGVGAYTVCYSPSRRSSNV